MELIEDLRKRELIYAAPGKELNWWRPVPEAPLALERYFDSQKSFQNEAEKEAYL